VPGRGGEIAAKAFAPVAGLYLDGDLPPAGHAAAEQDDPAGRFPGPDVIAVPQRAGDPRMANRSPGGSWPRTHAGSMSVKTTECAVSAMTPASRGDGCGRIVTLPSGGGYLPAATSLSSAASSGPVTASPAQR
jgi:hypothetical protein